MTIKQTPSRRSYQNRIMNLLLLFVLFSAFTFHASNRAGANAIVGTASFDTVTMPLKSDTGIIPAQEFFKILEKEGIGKGTAADFRSDPLKDLLIVTFANGNSAMTNLSEAAKLAPRMLDTSMIFTKMEIEASYPGGPVAYLRFLNRNFRYPAEAQKKEIQGTVIIQFIVAEDGNTSNAEAISGPVAGGLREEAVRLIRASGKWIPAFQSGKVVKSYKKQPVIFRLNTY